MDAECVCCAIGCGTRKRAAPIMVPTTMFVESSNPSARGNSRGGAVAVWKFMCDEYRGGATRDVEANGCGAQFTTHCDSVLSALASPTRSDHPGQRRRPASLPASGLP